MLQDAFKLLGGMLAKSVCENNIEKNMKQSYLTLR